MVTQTQPKNWESEMSSATFTQPFGSQAQTVHATGANSQGSLISGSHNQSLMAGRDLYLGDQYVVEDTLYSELKLEEPDTACDPVQCEALAELVCEQRLLVLAGTDLEEKASFARQLARLVRDRIQNGSVVHVREWYRSSDPQKIEAAFHESETTILLLPQILPHHLGHSLSHLLKLLQARRNYAIITTDGGRTQWGITDGCMEIRSWCELSWEAVYGSQRMADLLLDEIRPNDPQLPAGLFPEGMGAGPKSLLVDGLRVQEAAAVLKEPHRIRSFANYLLGCPSPVTPRLVRSQLEQLAGDQQAVHHWYDSCDRSSQLLSLGLALLDGLPDDQIFTALELLVERAWRSSDPLLRHFDYHDLAHLSAYFPLISTGTGGGKIEIRSRRRRQEILRAAWDFQRRRMLATLPVITALIKGSAGESAAEPEDGDDQAPGPNAAGLRAETRKLQLPRRSSSEKEWRELFGTKQRRRQLEEAAVESLSQIGLLSLEAVEPCFLDLVINGSPGVQRIAAKAMAAWRSSGSSDKLFNLLTKWWREGCQTHRTNALVWLVSRLGADSPAALRAAVAVTTALAAQYDPRNQLDPTLVKLFESMVQDRAPAVRSRFQDLVLPVITARHLRQVEALLRARVIPQEDLLNATAYGFSMAFSLRPDETLEVLEEWHGISRRCPKSTDGRVSPREHLIAVVALAYGYLRFEDGEELITAAQIVEKLRTILTEEQHPFVRAKALIAIGLQAIRNFELAAPIIQELVPEVTLPDRVHLVKVFVLAYLHEREQMQNGDDRLEVEGETYEVWTVSLRPLTPIEAFLYRCLEDDLRPVAQQVAVEAFAAFSATPLETLERELAARRRMTGVPASSPLAPPTMSWSTERLRKLDFLGEMAIYLTAPREPLLRMTLRPLLAEVVEMQRGNPNVPTYSAANLSRRIPLFPLVKEKWLAVSNDSVRRVARALSHATEIYRWRWAIVLLVLYLGFKLLSMTFG
jgi:hypothetical protein